MGETPRHITNMFFAVHPLGIYFADEPQAFVAANMFVYYERGNRHAHVSPDVFVVLGVPKNRTPERRRYLLWEEGKGPDLVIEFTSESTREEDIDDKMAIYQDTLRVPEYFLFDPFEEYLHPPLQGYRLVGTHYQVIEPFNGRLPSEVLQLHLEACGELLRFYNPVTGQYLPTPPEDHEARTEAESAREAEAAARKRAETARKRAETARKREAEARKDEAGRRQQAEAARQQAEAARQQAEAEAQRLRRELEELRRRLPGGDQT
jgi:Uma2 family endonuclease